jgi:hypothetical protein
VKRTKLSFPDCYSFLLEHHLENVRVFVNSLSLLLSMSHKKVFLFSYMFSCTVNKSWHFNKITLVEKMHKWGESGFFKKP